MKAFNCDPSWPICLFDFTFRNRSEDYLALRVKQNLSNYILDDYIGKSEEMGRIQLMNERNMNEEEAEVIRERNKHLCCEIKDFVRNFKVLFIKGDDFLLKNINLQFKLDDEMD